MLNGKSLNTTIDHFLIRFLSCFSDLQMIFYLVMCILWFIVSIVQAFIAYFAWWVWRVISCGFVRDPDAPFIGKKILGCWDPTTLHICVAHKPITMLRHLLTNVKDRGEPKDRERFIRSNAPTARPPTSERLVETLTGLNTNERREMAMSTITFLNTTDLLTTKSTGTLLNA